MNWRRLLFGREAPPDDRLTWADVAHFRSPLLRTFGAINLAAALFYGGLGTYGILKIMFFEPVVPFSIADMIRLLERSLAHSAVGGAALIADYVMTKLAMIAAMRRGEAPPPAKLPKP